MNKVTTAAEAIKAVRDGDTLLVGGFLEAGCPETLIGALWLQNVQRGDWALDWQRVGAA